MLTGVIELKKKNEFDIQELIQDLRTNSLSYNDGYLVDLLERLKKIDLVEMARDYFYRCKSTSYSGVYSDEDSQRGFWGEVEIDISPELSPNERDALHFASRGECGKEPFVIMMTWFDSHDYIRKDITAYNCRFFRYIDSYVNLAQKNIVNEIFRNYEKLRDMKIINKDVDALLEKSFSSSDLQLLWRQVEHDIKCFEINVRPGILQEMEKDIFRIHGILRSISDKILEIVLS